MDGIEIRDEASDTDSTELRDKIHEFNVATTGYTNLRHCGIKWMPGRRRFGVGGARS